MYTPLCIKTEYSLLNSMIKVSDLIQFAKKNNIKALTITDDNMFGVMEFYIACINNNIKPIVGLDLKEFNRILYAKGEKGYKNLLKITTLYRDKTLTEQYLKENCDNLICIVPFENRNNNYSYYENVFIAFKNKDEEEILENNKIYMNEILYFTKNDGKYYDYLKAIKEGKLLETSNNYDNYFKLESELSFDLTNNYKLEQLCDLKISTGSSLLPKYKCPDDYSSYDYLKQLCINGLKERFGTTVPLKYKERLKYELEVIHKMGFDDYFLIVYDYVRFAKENNILVGPGRGSAAGSLVSYVLKIIEVDPLKYGLLFERFLNEKRVTLPDIDVDFDGNRKDEVIKYCIEKYGSKRVAGIITFVTLGAKQVLKDIARITNYDMEEIDFLTRMIDSKLSLKENFDTVPKIRNEIKNNDELKEIYEIALNLEGLKKTTSVHASGIVMCDEDIDCYVPLEKHGYLYLTGYDMNYLEKIGLIKMDFLSLKTLTTIQNILDDIDEDIDLNNIDLNDEATINIFNKADTLGVFQFESDGIIQVLRKFKPTNFEDIYNVLALYRPGPMKNIDSFIRRRNKQEKINYFHNDLITILKSTYGIIVYQEQIMQIANKMANYTLGEADILRRAMSKKKEEILLNERNKFIEKSVNNGYERYLSEQIYDHILKFAEYGFNKSHSVAYAKISFQMAYLKAHYPSYFMKNLLSSVSGSDKNVKAYIYECKGNNTKILNPDINLSFKNYVVENDAVRFPLSGIKGLGIVIVDSILEERKKGLFKNIYDFLIRIDKRVVNRKAISTLIDSGSLDCFSLTRRTLNENIDILLNYAELVNELGSEFALKPEITMYEEYTKKEIIKMEYNVFGLYLNNHPVNDYRKKYNKPLSTSNIAGYQDRYIDIIVFVDKLKEITNKRNEKMCFMTVSDSYSTTEAVIFSFTYSQIPKIKENDIVLITGRVERRHGKDQIIVNKIKVLDE